MTAHLNKTHGRLPTLSDIKGTGSLGYDAAWSCIIRNTYREKSKNPLFLTRGGKKTPIVVAEVHKSKVGMWDDNLLWGLPLGVAKLVPLDIDEYLETNDIYLRSRGK